MNNIYITTSIPYVNAAPHVGFALELVQADAYARHVRLLGHDVRFQCGTDDNSLKNVRAAEVVGLQVRDFVNANADRFERLGGLLDISNEEFVRTSRDSRHVACVHALWRACADNGDLYRKAYEGLYCVGCEQFYEPSELDDGRCPEHGIPLEIIREENWFFRLSRYGGRLLELIETGKLRIVPAHRRNEILALLRRGLTDISVSRSAERARGWGVAVPDGDSPAGDEVVYVWFDALANYLTGLGHGSDPALLRHYWNDGQRIHIVGKGISKFHAIYWPAILLSAGLPPPSSLFVHGYVTVDGRKIGKSAGNGIDPEGNIDAYGTPDALRYYLLRHIRSGDDGDFSAERLEAAWSGELAGQLGNLANRVLALLSASFDGIVPPVPDSDFVQEADRLPAKVAQAFDAYELHVGLADIFEFIGEANRRFTKRAPWADAKALLDDLTPEDRKATAACLGACLAEQVYGLAMVARCLLPFLPGSAAKLHSRLGLPSPRLYRDPLIVGGVKTAPQAVLFPRRAAA
ncbi:methionine--tRNA ligase [Rhizobium chutanense]|uniref:Methionine--tRNA ligase n=1 Tax=Rhizobium chutanense TaxID=2035448 RepID=A0A3S0S2K7_9HYPH|nr:methionine--tRNA ligase [Rhizobium chutanense]RUM06884.1 methionine--tRNA ligase [Rhizobium chutanense]